jgi:predicted solute-binding protein
MDNITLQHYIDMYRQPLSEESLEAISKLSEMAVEKKKMKKVKKNNKACLGRLLCP